MKCTRLFIFFLLCACTVTAQIPEAVFSPLIKTIQLFPVGNQAAYPILRLNSSDRLELHFDDLNAGVKSYSYTFQLCNADWTPADLSSFDYIRGFSQVRISTYRVSSLALTHYTHYQATIPDANSYPTRSGNYILKVFTNGDTSQLLFTRRMMVIDSKATIAAQIQQPYNGQIFRTHQKVQFKVNLSEQLNLVNAMQQVKVAILQNNRSDNAAINLRPTFYSRTTLEYNTENDAVFPAGKEWRWLDLRSFRLQSDRVANAVYGRRSTEIFVRPDIDRSGQRFNFYRDNNGRYTIQATENINPLWQADYATVHFTFVPPGNAPFGNKDVFLFGQLTGYNLDPGEQMEFNREKGIYEKTIVLKQGYYDYMYVTIDKNDRSRKASFASTEGNIWESENDYTILVYYRPLGGRADELIAVQTLNSVNNSQGIR